MSDGEIILQGIIREFLVPIYQLAAAVAVIYFMWGVVRYIYELRNPSERMTGRAHMLWGMVGLLIIFSVGAILSSFNDAFGSVFGF